MNENHETTGGMTDAEAWRIVRQLAAPTSNEPPSVWVARHVVFDEAGNRGPFMLAGREYAAEILDDFARGDVTDETLVTGSQVGKTTILMAAVAWCLEHSPGGILWAMDSIGNVRTFVKGRFRRMLLATQPTRALVPTGIARHDFSMQAMILGPTTIRFTGSNSAGNLASTPCRRTILDEVDKFDEGMTTEADAVSLAEQRTKDSALAQRWKTSTPTIVDGLIWTAFVEGDQRRYFVPCPACGGFVVLAWSKEHTIFPLTGAEAFIEWDESARMDAGEWDYSIVERTARARCPHCQHLISDTDKPAMNTRGQWRATVTNAPAGHVSRHLPSLYSTSPEVTWGKLAVRFLKKRGTIFGLKGFVTGDLAEPFVDRQRSQVLRELIVKEAAPDGHLLMTVDVQAVAPHFWFVVRRWNAGCSVGIDAGSLDTWDEVRAKQEAHSIPDSRVFVDSGWDTAVVYQQCWRHHRPEAGYMTVNRALLPMCWNPMKGEDGRKPWLEGEGKNRMPTVILHSMQDPFIGSQQAGQWLVDLVTFRSDACKDILEALREKRMGSQTWEVLDSVADETYQRHLMAEENRAFVNSKTGRVAYKWAKVGGSRTPNHLLDCETMQIAAALSLGLFQYEVKA